MTETARRIVLARRPQGMPAPDDFRLEDTAVPEPADGQVLVRTIWLSLDPYMRGRIGEGPSYAKGTEPGELMQGEGVGQVLASRNDAFVAGDFVAGHGGWQSHFLLPGDKLRKLDPKEAPLSTALGILGMPGMTAYTGLMAIGRPKAGETLVTGAASGAVGAVAGQIAKLKGLRVVGIAGGAGQMPLRHRGAGLRRLPRPQPARSRRHGCRRPARTASTSMSSSPPASRCGPPCP